MAGDVAGDAIAAFEELIGTVEVALYETEERDWEAPAGSLDWTCRETAGHLVDVLFSYAFQLAGRAAGGWLPFEGPTAQRGATPVGLVDGILGTARLHNGVLRTAPPDAQGLGLDRRADGHRGLGGLRQLRAGSPHPRPRVRARRALCPAGRLLHEGAGITPPRSVGPRATAPGPPC